ncbi:MAG: class I SAM-dependent methyltransferase [Gemmatimonadaceae bacterium]|nr:class I SAM-dependent methyltransferase [Gloeobacterales cyanobacterium ES-bin-141]
MTHSAQTGFGDLEDWYAQSLGRRYLSRCWEVIAPLLVPLAEQEVLDAGCGAGHYSELLAQGGALVQGTDTDVQLLERARRRVPAGRFRAASINALPYADESFDTVLCCNVLEFVPDPAGALRELRRVARDRGVICVLNRDSPWGWQQQFARPFTDHPYYQGQFFDRERLKTLALASGWQVEQIRGTVFFPPVPVEFFLDWLENLPWLETPGGCWVASLRRC